MRCSKIYCYGSNIFKPTLNSVRHPVVVAQGMQDGHPETGTPLLLHGKMTSGLKLAGRGSTMITQ